MSAAEIIRSRDESGQITILSNERHLFYSRPGVAYYLSGQIPAEQLIARKESFYREHRLLLRHAEVASLEPAVKKVTTTNGENVPYDVLLIATGAAAVPPPFKGGALAGVVTLDTLDDARKVVSLSKKAKRAVVSGGGITAMELAEGLQHRGVKTTLLQRQERIWPRLFDARESSIILDAVHHERIKVLFNQEIEEIEGHKGRVRGVRLKSGEFLRCEIVGVAIGVRPNIAFTHELPLEKDRGLLVDSHMQTSIPTIFAAGDVAQVLDRWTGKHHLDILWPSAINEGRAAGHNMVDVAHGAEPRYAYHKGTPFNAALLFGVHLSVIGQLGSQGEDTGEELLYMSRGSSSIWTAPFSSSYRSAWDKKGSNSLRIVTADRKIVGALLLGDQHLADPLRTMIENEVDISEFIQELQSSGDSLPSMIHEAWKSRKLSRSAAGKSVI